MKHPIFHSFTEELADQLGIQQALLVHHFQLSITLNLRHNRNFQDGHTWSYQTIKEIQGRLPYLTLKAVRYHLEALVKKGILIKSNYNKSPMDNTCWYAFKDEKTYLGKHFPINLQEGGKQ